MGLTDSNGVDTTMLVGPTSAPYASGGGAGELYPWMNQSNQINSGFRDQLINDNITEIRSGVTGLANQLCNCCSDVQMALANGFAGVEQGANARQIANMQQAFGAQTAVAADPPTTENFFNATSTAIITVPKGCCLSVAVENVSEGPTAADPAPAILVQNANLVVDRIA